jgi:hypothetical protein
MEETVFDIETDGFLDVVSKVHVVSYQTPAMESPKSIVGYEGIREFFNEGRVFIGHYITGFDFRALEKVLGIPRPKVFYDTLPLAQTLLLGRGSYGLESFGEDYGIPKPKVTDWSEQPIEVYINRCEEDVKINMCLWLDLRRKLGELYGYA